MSALPPERIRELLDPYYPEVTSLLLAQLSAYLDLLLRWNARMNLTAIRNPEAIVQRHFGESLFLAHRLPATARTLVDLGSGGGFPGLPAQLAVPELRVTLAESQQKKVSFLREVVRDLGLTTEVWPRRAESFPSDRRFDVVALRAVDNPTLALKLAERLLEPGGSVFHLTTYAGLRGLSLQVSGKPASFVPLP